MITCRRNNVSRPKTYTDGTIWYDPYRRHAFLAVATSHRTALSEPAWCNAMEDEFDALESNRPGDWFLNLLASILLGASGFSGPSLDLMARSKGGGEALGRARAGAPWAYPLLRIPVDRFSPKFLCFRVWPTLILIVLRHWSSLTVRVMLFLVIDHHGVSFFSFGCMYP
jgi:hypothetical protein